MRPHRLAIWCIGFVLLAAASAKEPSAQVMVWPPSGPPVVRFSFGKFKETSAGGKQHNYTTDVTAENLWKKNDKSCSRRKPDMCGYPEKHSRQTDII